MAWIDESPLFTVVDTLTGREADPEEVALDEHKFASQLIYCDMDNWYVDPYGNLALLDECGSYDVPFDDRFRLVWNSDALRRLLGMLEAGEFDAHGPQEVSG